jgi:ribosomal protein L5|tara:strand:+ start:12213 stop:12851 length:639 start_codon:yes stop_codon:yes gene_type:complete
MNSVFTNSFSHNNYESYISNCDLINKYNVKSVHQIPKLDKIVLELDMKDLLNSYEISSKDQTDSVAQVKAFLILYIFIGLFPYIKASKAVSSSGRLKTTNLQYSLKVVLRRKEEINNFLFSLFVENWQKLSLEDFKLFKNERVKSKAEKTFVLNTLLPADCFFDISEFLSKSLTGVNSKNLKFRLNFSFNSSINVKDRNKLIKNLPFFWISG